MTSPVTTEWLGLPADIRSAAETAVGHLRPLTHAETLLIVGRAIKAERERDGWQPIETAPRDGTWILVYEPTEYGPSHHVVRWGTPEWGGREKTWVTVALGPNPDTYDADEATHWQPLPPSPKPAAVSEGGEDE